MEAWQAIGALGCSTKSWGSVLDVILGAQGLALLGTLQGNIEATQTDSGSARHLFLGKRKSQNVAICKHRMCKASPVKLGQLVSRELRICRSSAALTSVFRALYS